MLTTVEMPCNPMSNIFWAHLGTTRAQQEASRAPSAALTANPARRAASKGARGHHGTRTRR
eukprot:704258-Pyramimonas_sp.AAC.1